MIRLGKPGTIAALTLCVVAHEAAAANRRQIRNINIGFQSVMTVASALIQGNIRSPRQFFICLLSGAAAGYGFVEAKEAVSRRRVAQGVMIANVATSLSENAAAGQNPVAYLGYTVGPFRLRVATPFAANRPAYVNVDFSEVEAVALLKTIAETNGDATWQDGLIVFSHTGYLDEEDRYIGGTYGVFPIITDRARDGTYEHEAVHVLQALQLDSLEPPLLSADEKQRAPAPRIFRFGHFKAGFLHLAVNIADHRRRYENRWAEIEADHFEP